MTDGPDLPIGPLLEALGRGSIRAASRRSGIPFTTLHRAIRRGCIGVWTADRVATHILDTHPVLIWGDQWHDPDWYRAGRIDAAFDQLHQEMAS